MELFAVDVAEVVSEVVAAVVEVVGSAQLTLLPHAARASAEAASATSAGAVRLVRGFMCLGVSIVTGSLRA